VGLQAAGVRPGLVEGRRGAAVVRGADLDELAAGVAVQRVGVIVDRHALGGAWRRVVEVGGDREGIRRYDRATGGSHARAGRDHRACGDGLEHDRLREGRSRFGMLWHVMIHMFDYIAGSPGFLWPRG
jgi:Arc/MetJ family transcription regulator